MKVWAAGLNLSSSSHAHRNVVRASSNEARCIERKLSSAQRQSHAAPLSAAPAYPVRHQPRRGRSRQRPFSFEPLPRTALPALARLLGFLPSASGSRTSCLVGETLAHDTTEHLISASGIIHAKRDAVRVAELELCKVAVKVLFRAVLIDAAHTAFEDGERAFDGVGGHIAARIFPEVVHHRRMLCELAANAPIH